jgi:hypothetical protein
MRLRIGAREALDTSAPPLAVLVFYSFASQLSAATRSKAAAGIGLSQERDGKIPIGVPLGRVAAGLVKDHRKGGELGLVNGS